MLRVVTFVGGLLCVLAGIVACGGETPAVPPGPLTITSSAFSAGAPIPKRHTGEGEDVSPPLAWSDVPADAEQLVLVVDDPDAPRAEPWVHWVLYGLAPTTTSLPEGGSSGGIEGVNDFGNPGWGGPMPPPGHGVHQYHFTLYAVDTAEALPPGLTKEEVLRSIEGRVLTKAELVGTYERR